MYMQSKRKDIVFYIVEAPFKNGWTLMYVLYDDGPIESQEYNRF